MNAGQKLERLDLKRKHYEIFEKFLKSLNKPLIVAGDINVSHKECDLARPKTNTKSAGFTLEERQDFTRLLESCLLVDSYRSLNPNIFDKYTYYSYRFDCRKKNIGYKIYNE
jgi:exodeoxyribonuclease III